jgi:hypothetical protein
MYVADVVDLEDARNAEKLYKARLQQQRRKRRPKADGKIIWRME